VANGIRYADGNEGKKALEELYIYVNDENGDRGNICM
jgi:hypothetical protein